MTDADQAHSRGNTTAQNGVGQRNPSCGLTHNGHMSSQKVRRVSSRRAQMLGRIRASMEPGACGIALPKEMRFVIGKTPVALRLRAWEPWACIDLQEESPPGMEMQGWVSAGSVTPAGFVRAIRPGGASQDLIPASALSPASFRKLIWSPDFTHIAAEWDGPAGRFTVDIDVPLQDQQNLETDLVRDNDWAQWLENHFSQAFSASTARNMTFNSNMRLLHALLPRPKGVWVRYTWTPGDIYRFLAHQKLIREQDMLKRSHALRLAELGFLFGRDKAPAASLFRCPILFGRGPVPKEERRQYNADRLEALLGVRTPTSLLVGANEWKGMR